MSEHHSKPPTTPFGVSKVHFCPQCRKPLCRKDGKMGPIWSCTGFPDCQVSMDDVEGKPSREPDEKYCCPVCTRRMFRKTDKAGETFWICTGSSRGCVVVLRDDSGKPETAYRCTKCGHLLILRRGKYGMFWGCSQYPECTQTFGDRNGKPDLDFLTAEDS